MKSLRKEIEADKEKSNARVAKRAERKAKKKLSAAKLSKYKFDEPDKEVQITEELTGSLRLLKVILQTVDYASI